MSVRRIAAGMAAMVLVLLPTELLAGGEWPDSPNKAWFENLQRPDNDKNPHRQADPKSLFCCGVADTVKTKFKVEEGNERYPEDRWYAWLKNDWCSSRPRRSFKTTRPTASLISFCWQTRSSAL